MHRTRFFGGREGWRHRRAGGPAHDGGRHHAEELLREVAYVLRLARSVKEEITAGLRRPEREGRGGRP
jgi:hypothetical protein